MAPTLYSRVDDIPTPVLTGLAKRFFVDPTSESRFDSKNMTREENDALARLCESAGIHDLPGVFRTS